MTQTEIDKLRKEIRELIYLISETRSFKIGRLLLIAGQYFPILIYGDKVKINGNDAQPVSDWREFNYSSLWQNLVDAVEYQLKMEESHLNSSNNGSVV